MGRFLLKELFELIDVIKKLNVIWFISLYNAIEDGLLKYKSNSLKD